MSNIFYGATKEQAISNAEKALNVDRKILLINILEEPEGKTIFNILNPKNVKIDVVINEEKRKLLKRINSNKQKRISGLTPEELNNNKIIINNFLDTLKSFNLCIDYDYNLILKDKDFYINFKSSNDAILIGNRGSTINAIQTYLQNLLILKCSPSANVFLDAGGYKEKREKYLTKLAEDSAFLIRQTGETIDLEPMPSFERKKIHDILLNFPDLDTKSEGKEPHRHIVIFPYNGRKEN